VAAVRGAYEGPNDGTIDGIALGDAVGVLEAVADGDGVGVASGVTVEIGEIRLATELELETSACGPAPTMAAPTAKTAAMPAIVARFDCRLTLTRAPLFLPCGNILLPVIARC
jgi:hypothetical protein